MRIFLAIAWRNVMRNKKRSMLTIVSISVGLVAMIMIWSMFDGMYPMLVSNLTSFMGHIDITRPEYVDKPFLENAVTDGGGIIDTVAANPAVTAYSPRLVANGLVSFGSNSQGAVITGLDPDLESEFGRLTEIIGAGGRWLEPGDAGIVLGAVLAKNLDVGLGDEVLLVISDRSKQLAYIGPLAVKGLIKSGVPDIDRSTAYVERRMLAGSLFVDAGSGEAAGIDRGGVFTNLLLRVKNPDMLESVEEELQGKMPAGVTVRTWKEVTPWVESSFNTKVGFAYIVFSIVLLIVMAGILNTVLMSVIERTREFGIMRSLGTKRWQIFSTVSLESALLGVVGIAAGLVVGIGLVTVLGYTGIDMFSAMDEDMLGQFYMIDRIFYPRLGLEHLATTCAMIMVAVFLVAIYPAGKAASLQPVEAIKSLG